MTKTLAREQARELLYGSAGSRDDYVKLINENSAASTVHACAVQALVPLIPFDMLQFADQYADFDQMAGWAEHVIASRPADFLIEDGDGDLYMRRWYVIPRNAGLNVYLHEIVRSDKDVMHDHPWDSHSMILAGGYVEQTPEGSFTRKPGDVITRLAEDAHRLILPEGQARCLSLFITGPRRREWGFWCPGGWVSWQDFTGGSHAGRGNTGRGCGELG